MDYYNHYNYGNSPFSPKNDFKDYKNDTDPLSVGEWLITLIVLAIPFINIIMLFVWSFSDSTNLNKKNFCRASLILSAIAFVFLLLTRL